MGFSHWLNGARSCEGAARKGKSSALHMLRVRLATVTAVRNRADLVANQKQLGHSSCMNRSRDDFLALIILLDNEKTRSEKIYSSMSWCELFSGQRSSRQLL